MREGCSIPSWIISLNKNVFIHPSFWICNQFLFWSSNINLKILFSYLLSLLLWGINESSMSLVIATVLRHLSNTIIITTMKSLISLRRFQIYFLIHLWKNIECLIWLYIVCLRWSIRFCVNDTLKRIRITLLIILLLK